jgi:8-oxo-dGTP pyrophosphatase MutT (NUDIX family)
MLDEENNVWKPALGLFGGKVGPYDKDWLHTAAREFMEETGELVGDLDSGIPAKMSRFQVEDEDEAFRYTKYLEYSKYQVLYYPVEEADREHIRSLPRRYTQTFKGEISADWTRAATRLEPVILRKDSELGWAVYDIQTMQRHELPSKVPLLMALKAAEFPPMPAPLEPQHLPSLADILGDELDQLLNIRCDTGVKKSKPSKRKSRASKPNSSLRPLSESKSENMFALLAGHSSNEVMCV